jgi:hypothetical protein
VAIPQKHHTADGFGDTAWFEAWYEAFAPGTKRYPVLMPDVAPQPELLHGSVKVLRQPVRFLGAPVNSHTPRYGWRLANDVKALAVSEVLADAIDRSQCSGIELSLLAEHGGTLTVLRNLSASGQWMVAVDEAETTALIDVTGEWETYRRGLSSNLNRTLNWKENKLRRLGKLTFQDVGGDANYVAWLSRALELEAQGWKGREGSAILQRRNEAQFYQTIAATAVPEGRLRLFVLTLDGRLIAFQLLVAEDGVLFLLKLAYSEDFASWSPGGVLQRLVLQACFADAAVHTVDLAGPGDWKLRWATRREQLMRIRLVPARSVVGYMLRGETMAKRFRDRFKGPEAVPTAIGEQGRQ